MSGNHKRPVDRIARTMRLRRYRKTRQRWPSNSVTIAIVIAGMLWLMHLVGVVINVAAHHLLRLNAKTRSRGDLARCIADGTDRFDKTPVLVLSLRRMHMFGPSKHNPSSVRAIRAEKS
jgi:hypothetical protein